MTEQKSIFRSLRENLTDLFIEKKAYEFEKFSANIQQESDLTGLNRMHADRVASAKLLHAGIVEHVGSIQTADLPQSVFKFLAAQGVSNLGVIQSVASQLVAVDFIARHAEEIIKASEKHVADTQAEYVEFIKVNRAVLKRLVLAGRIAPLDGLD